MQPRDWTVCIIEPNKFDAQIIVDILRGIGVTRVKVFHDSAAALQAVDLFAPNIIVIAHDAAPMDGVTWTKAFRRNLKAQNRKAAVFVTARALSRAIAEDCRHGGANAVIAKPLSSQNLLGTIKKVFAAAREFIDAAGYVGPCRRAGIITTDAPKRRRQSDDASKLEEAPASGLGNAVAALQAAVAAFAKDGKNSAACVEALTAVQASAAAAGDGPLMRVCASFSLQLSQGEKGRETVAVCMKGVEELADPAQSDAAQRDATAERVRQEVAKAARRAA